MYPAEALITNPKRFTSGTLARDSSGSPCGTGKSARPCAFDCLGALLWAYRDFDYYSRHDIAKHVFKLCRDKFGHTYLGKLQWEQALWLLREARA